MTTLFTISLNGQSYSFDPSQPIDLSLPLVEGDQNPNCYFAENVKFETIRMGTFVGSVAEGGPCNYQKITLTPHGNGTHTECYGHISAKTEASLYHCLKKFLYLCYVISMPVRQKNNDLILLLEDLKAISIPEYIEALVIRSTPNTEEKKRKVYSGTNPPYFEEGIGKYLAMKNINHWLVDLPSVDRESDGGVLQNHKDFWNFPDPVRTDCTITELVFVTNEVKDGLYLLNLQTTSLCMDASPSKPLLYSLYETSGKA